MKSSVKISILACLTIFLYACESTVIYTNQHVGKPKQVVKENSWTENSQQKEYPQHEPKAENKQQVNDNGRTEYMIASWYGNPFHGRKTANGETFNMHDLTAAHRTLPFGTRLKLINENNNKEAIVRINDRGPVPLERDIDVSYKTAQELGFVEVGLAKLKVIYLD